MDSDANAVATDTEAKGTDSLSPSSVVAVPVIGEAKADAWLSKADQQAGHLKWRLDQWLSKALYADPHFKIEISTGADEFLIRLNRR